MSCKDFTFDHYRKTLYMFQAAGYELVPFRYYKKDMRKVLILRHDIEFNPLRALEIAKIEKEVGVSSTFFLRLHANEYNAFGFNTTNIVDQIIELGHEIGLHSEGLFFMDVMGIKRDYREYVQTLREDKKMMDEFFNINVVSVAPHGDNRAKKDSLLGDFEMDFMRYDQHGIFEKHVYSTEFFGGSEFIYLSDSNGIWQEGCICEHLNNHNKIQMLTHPYLWYEKHYYLGRTYPQ